MNSSEHESKVEPAETAATNSPVEQLTPHAEPTLVVAPVAIDPHSPTLESEATAGPDLNLTATTVMFSTAPSPAGIFTADPGDPVLNAFATTPVVSSLPSAAEALPSVVESPKTSTAAEPTSSESQPASTPPIAIIEPMIVTTTTSQESISIQEPPATAQVAQTETVGGPSEAEAPRPAAPTVPALPPQPVPTVPPAPQQHDLSRIAQDFQIRKVHVEAVVQLLDEGNTVPFITRYRKERTGGLDEEVIRRIHGRVEALRSLAERKQIILKSIAGQGRLTDELTAAILDAEQPKRLEDLYLPFKPKKRTLASDALEKGLEPFAQAVWNRDPVVGNLSETASGLVNPDRQLNTPEEILAGVRHILAEVIAELADVRGSVRAFLRDTAVIVTVKTDNVPEGKGQEYRDYFEFKEAVRQMPPHRILAVNRGEHEKVIRAKLEWNPVHAKEVALANLPLAGHPHLEFLLTVVDDALERLLMPSLEREIRREMTEFAQDHGVDIFARNLRSLLLRAPLGGVRILAIDPGIRTGCKLAVLDETGTLLEDSVVYPHPPQKQVEQAKRKIEQLVRKHQTRVIAIGNGTGCRETEEIVSALLAEFEQRRINPTPVAAVEPPVVSAGTTAVMPPSLPGDASSEPPSSSEVAPPVAGEAISLSTMSNMAMTFVGSATATAETVVTMALSPPISTEVSVSVDAPTAGDTPTPVVSAPAIPVQPPPLPVIDLTGLPEPPPELAYVIVNEAGASDYSASPIAKEEFPTLDATARGTVSIGRRLQDPLAELVKIDPQHVGVGLYQHDMRPKYMKDTLEAVIESCVNNVGVDVNTASVPLLRHVSGLNQLVARELVEYRKKNGPFRSRTQLQSVPQMGETRFTQAAGFLKIRTGEDPLDNTWVHPESYHIARGILSDMGYTPGDLTDKAKLADIREKLRTLNPEAIANTFKVGPPTVRDIFEAIARPGRDIREDRPAPIFRKGVLKLEDLKPGMQLKGEILNVVDFGAFVDVGLKDSGLVHISQMANRFIKSPYEVAGVGDVVDVFVMNVDSERKRVSLSMIPPGVERGRPPEPQQREPREFREPREPRGPGERRPQGPGERRPQGPPRGNPGGPPRQFGPPQEGQAESRGPAGERSGPPQSQENRPPRGGDRMPQGGGPGGPPRGGFVPRPGGGPGPGTRPGGNRPPGQWRGGPPSAPQPGGSAPPPGTQAPGSGPQQGPPPAPPRPARNKPVPKLSQEQKVGKAALNTFAELAAFFTPPAPPAPPTVVPPPPAPEPQPAKNNAPETPPPETPPNEPSNG